MNVFPSIANIPGIHFLERMYYFNKLSENSIHPEDRCLSDYIVDTVNIPAVARIDLLKFPHRITFVSPAPCEGDTDLAQPADPALDQLTAADG